MKDLTHYLVTNIIDNPDTVTIDESVDDRGTTLLTIHVNPADIGKVIGKEGRTINAIRDIVKIKAMKENKYIDITVAEE